MMSSHCEETGLGRRGSIGYGGHGISKNKNNISKKKRVNLSNAPAIKHDLLDEDWRVLHSLKN